MDDELKPPTDAELDDWWQRADVDYYPKKANVMLRLIAEVRRQRREIEGWKQLINTYDKATMRTLEMNSDMQKY